jgi:acetolactate synthase small subunit
MTKMQKNTIRLDKESRKLTMDDLNGKRVAGTKEYTPEENLANAIFEIVFLVSIAPCCVPELTDIMKEYLNERQFNILSLLFGFTEEGPVEGTEIARRMGNIDVANIYQWRDEALNVLRKRGPKERISALMVTKRGLYKMLGEIKELRVENRRLAGENERLISNGNALIKAKRKADSNILVLQNRVRNSGALIERLHDEMRQQDEKMESLEKSLSEKQDEVAVLEKETMALADEIALLRAEIEKSRRQGYEEGRADGLRTAATEAFSNGYATGYNKGFEEGRAQVGKDFQNAIESAEAKIEPIVKNAEERRKKCLIEDIIPDERIIRKLHRRGIYTAVDLSQLTEKELHDDFHLGSNDIFVIKISLKQKGLTLKTAK